MYLLRMGIVFAGGCGVSSFEEALARGRKEAAATGADTSDRSRVFAYRVDLESASNRHILTKIRRSDRLSKMAVLAAAEALGNCQFEGFAKDRLGVIVATAFGAHPTTFGFLDDILEFGEKNVSPTAFSNSVHNAAASYISSALDIQGPTLTVTRFYFSFHYALHLGKTWLDLGLYDHVLVGAVDQYGDVLQFVYDRKLTPAPNGELKPFNFDPAFQVPGEGAVFFLLGRRASQDALCRIEEIRLNACAEASRAVSLNIIDTDGMLSDESAYLSSLSEQIPTAAYSPLYGSMMIGSAFNCAAGALMLKRQILFANPVTDNPHGINLISKKQSGCATNLWVPVC
ncbi:MAG: beta-ketoacyl synthase N-terminal-like domain-containing protein [Pseudomonadota bacterium]